jgi:DNA-binding FadR family transcriptional regulator
MGARDVEAIGRERDEPTQTSGPAELEPLRTPQLYELIADRLADEIRHAVLRPADRLPSERELARQLEVSRSSVREAITALQVEGVLETRAGAGSFVATNALERLTRLAERDGDRPRLPRPADASPSALLEMRVAYEPQVARLAATHARPDAYAVELLELMERQPDPESREARANWNDADRLFHRQIGVMTGNPVIVAICEWIAEIMDQPLWQRLRDQSVAVPGRMRIHMAEHRLIYESVAGGDIEAAEIHARKHIERVRGYMNLD